jgi:E2/UBC family protein A
VPALPRDVVARVIELIQRHPAVVEVSEVSRDSDRGIVTLDVTFRVSLPNAWMARGESPNGVRAAEVVRFGFPPDFPLRPPSISLRPDFDRNLPHIQPWLEESDRPVPCIVDGPLSEFVHQEGLRGVLNQTSAWLERAALDHLIDPEQGWEPVRRDDLDDYLVADAGFLRSQAGREAGYQFFDFDYVRLTRGKRSTVHGEISETPAKLRNPQVRSTIFSERAVGDTGRLSIGRSVALIVWAGTLPSGQPFVVGTYKPETVTDVAGLMARAVEYGCDRPLQTALSWLRSCVRDRRDDGPFAMAIVLLARRPFKVIGADSTLELCPYVTDVSVPALFEQGERTAIRPAGHRDRIQPGLLRRLGGYGNSEAAPWTLLGCGSLGSKLAIHLTRVGLAPSVVVDKRAMSPHNAARHALIPPERGQFLWTDSKAALLAEAIRGFGGKAAALAEDVIDLIAAPSRGREAWPPKTWGVVNATASLNVREALAAAGTRIQARVLECSLFAHGRVGLLSVEGPERNPDTGDLITAAYRLMMGDPELARLVFGEAAEARRERVGESCGSLTMVMSDARVSVFGACMSEAIAEMQRISLPSTGSVLIGRMSEDGCNLVWTRHTIVPNVRIGGARLDGWCVHVAAVAAQKIEQDIARWPRVESGGVLMGRLSEAAKTFYIEDVLPAPEDSVRTMHGFILGREGLHQKITQFAETAGWSLYCLGTWHSHLEPSEASGLDRATAQAIALSRLTPSVLLIHTPRGYEIVVATSRTPTA